MVEMEFLRIMIRDGDDGQIVVLKEKDGPRQFPIFIGTFEATIIDRYVREIETPRPLTHDLLINTIAQLGGTLETIVVCDLRNNTFFATLHVRTDTGIVEIDSRPSDAIALAMSTSADIFAEEHVIRLTTGGTDPA